MSAATHGSEDRGRPGTHLAATDSPDNLRDAVRVFLSYPSPRILGALLGGSLVARVAMGGFSPWDAVVLLAVAVYWPLQEWILHATLLHLRPRRVLGRRVDPVFAQRHRAHHREPWRFDLIFLPPWVHAFTAPTLAALLWVLLPVELACTAMFGLVAMAIQYEWIHFLVHTRFWPRRRWLQRLWRNHRLHHFKSEKHWFGFTMEAVDRLFGTAPDPRTIPTSPTCRTLGVDEEERAA